MLVLENVKAKLHTKANYIILNLDFYFVAFCVYVHFNPFLCKKSAVDVSFFFYLSALKSVIMYRLKSGDVSYICLACRPCVYGQTRDDLCVCAANPLPLTSCLKTIALRERNKWT